MAGGEQKFRWVERSPAEAALVGPENVIAYRPAEYQKVPMTTTGQELAIPEASAPAPQAQPQAAKPQAKKVRSGMHEETPAIDVDALLAQLDSRVGTALAPQRVSADSHYVAEINPTHVVTIDRDSQIHQHPIEGMSPTDLQAYAAMHAEQQSVYGRPELAAYRGHTSWAPEHPSRDPAPESPQIAPIDWARSVSGNPAVMSGPGWKDAVSPQDMARIREATQGVFSNKRRI